MKNIKNTQTGFALLHFLPVILAVAVVGFAGFQVYDNQQKPKVVNSEADVKTSTLLSPLPPNLLSVDKVKELALSQKPTLSIVGVELENEDGTLVYKVKLSDGTKLAFNALTGTVYTKDVENEIDGTAALPADLSTLIGFAKAREIALARMPNATVHKIELESEEGKLVYSVRFTDESRVDVNATDGVVVRTKPAKKTETKPHSKTDDSSSSESNDSENDSSSGDDSGSNSGSGSSGHNGSSDSSSVDNR